MKKIRKVTALIFTVLFAGLTVIAAQKKPAPKPAGKVAQKPVAGQEERELLNVPAPTAAKLPTANYENEDISKNETRGTFTFTASAGIYNFTNKTENPQTNTSRSYTLPFDYTTMFGVEFAFRLGKDKDRDHDTKTGFHYYRSNKGIFTDFEIGFKTQRTEEKPSRFTFSETSGGVTTELPLDLGYDYTTTAFMANTVAAAANLRRAGISPELRQSVGKASIDATMFYANTYYHFTWLNAAMNWGHAFRWFDASIGPSLRVWYYKDYSDPVRVTTRNDDWTYSTFMLVYRQYIQFHPMVRLRTHFYFPALTYFTQLAKSPRFNESEYILNTALEICAIRVGNVGLIVSGGYEGHWWNVNPYSSDKYVRTGFVGDNGFTDANYGGFEHKSRTSWEGFASIAVEYHFNGEAPEKFTIENRPAGLPAAKPAVPAAGKPGAPPKRPR